MSKLTEIHIQGFRSLRDLKLTELGPVTVLIGPNGSGKSNLLAALRMVTLMATKSMGLFVGQAGGASGLLHYGPQQTPVMGLRLKFETDTGALNAYQARLGYAARDAFVYLDEQTGYRELEGEWQWVSAGAGHSESRIDEVGPARTPRTVLWLLKRLNFFHFHDTSYTSALRTNARFEDDRFLRSNGSNLPAYLLSLRDSQDAANQAAFRRIQELVRQIAPFIRELSPKVLDGGAVRLDWIDDRGEVFGAHQLSDGTLRAIALFTALAQPVDRLPLFCTIDEPELGLHPAALSLFSELVRSASHHCQIMLATQSSALLDFFDAEEVIVTERVDAATTFRRLRLEALTSWLADYQLSELYVSNVLCSLDRHRTLSIPVLLSS